MRWGSLTLNLAWRSVKSPRLAAALVRVGWRFRRRDWYKRFPFLPLPAAEYVRWRMHTAYGSDDAIPSADDVARYSLWATRDR